MDHRPHAEVHAHPGAEAFSFWTHAAAAIAAVGGFVWLLTQAHGPLATAAVTVYGSSLILLFVSSSFHHVVGTWGPGWHGVSRRLDHIAIFLLIAGTYTPVVLLRFPPGWGWTLFGVIWGFALAGTLLKALRPHTPRWATTGLYLAMGWAIVVAAYPLAQAFPAQAIALLLAGGFVYSVGAVIYARKRPDPWPHYVGFHGLWHLFVVAGALLHALFIGHWVL